MTSCCLSCPPPPSHFTHPQGGPYYCAQGDVNTAEVECEYLYEEINVNSLIEYTTKFQSEDLIDDTSNMKDDRVWILSGKDGKQRAWLFQ